MFAPNNPYFGLSECGKEEWGHIFPDGQVPIANIKDVPMIHLADTSQDGECRMCTVDWLKLTEQQQSQICTALSEIQDARPDEIKSYFDHLGYLPFRMELVIEAYDPRFFV